MSGLGIVQGTSKVLSPRNSQHAIPIHLDPNSKTTKVEELLAKLQDVRSKITNTYADLRENVPALIGDNMDSKLAELRERAQQRQLMRENLLSQPLAGDAQDPQNGPSPDAATKLAHGNNAPVPMEAVQPRQEQALATDPAVAGKKAATIRSASTTGATDAEAQIEDFFAGYDSNNKEMSRPVRRLPSELQLQIHSQAGRAPRKPSSLRPSLPTVAESHPIGDHTIRVPGVEGITSALPTVSHQPPQAGAGKASVPPNFKDPASTCTGQLSQTLPLGLKGGASSTPQPGTSRRMPSKALLPHASSKEAQVLSATMAPPSTSKKPHPPPARAASGAVSSGGALGVTLAVAKFKRGHRPASEATNPTPPSSMRRQPSSAQAHRRVRVPTVATSSMSSEEARDQEPIPTEAWDGTEIKYESPRLYS